MDKFDWQYYLDKYPDLRINGIHSEQQAKQHWIDYGEKEGRVSIRTPLIFDWQYYLDKYPDLRINGVHTEQQALQHWFSHGLKEERMSNINISLLSNRKMFITLTCYNINGSSSGWYLPSNNESGYINAHNTGCGNMLFQIASGLYYAFKNNATLYVPSLNTYLRMENLQLSDTIFKHIKTELTIEYDENNIIGSPYNLESIFNYNFYNNITLCGYFENIDNFNDYKPTILEYFRPSEVEKQYLFTKYPIIINTDINLCSVHIRKGADFDIIWSKERLDIMDNCTHELLDHMINEYNIYNFFVLTNDKRHCYTILNNNIKYKNINFHYSNERDFYDIWIISLIRYNIVSGSTLSWWGSYLNEHTDKYIVGHNNLGTVRNPEWKFI